MTVMAYDLTGRTALVTGAAGGIGRATAIGLRHGRSGRPLRRSGREGARQTADHIAATGGSAHAHALDVADRTKVAATVAAAVRAGGHLDVMANIAGIMHSSPVLETDDDDLDRVLAVNFKGVLYGCQEAARAMIAQGTAIVTMASGAIVLTRAARDCCVTASARPPWRSSPGPSPPRWAAMASASTPSPPAEVRTPMTERNSDEERRLAEEPWCGARRWAGGRTGGHRARRTPHLASDATTFTTGQILAAPEWRNRDAVVILSRLPLGREGPQCTGSRLSPQPPTANAPSTGPVSPGCIASRRTDHHQMPPRASAPPTGPAFDPGCRPRLP